ncbi:hypothetical protein Syun_030185 [Stephania yunnanensis]|uniref:Uncharacterized protein n=1 Tax=Stephania yunnanensis TaxID=152371 RepID=A0AAP0E734_9MAGN
MPTAYEISGRVWVKYLRHPMTRLYSVEFTKVPSASFPSCNFASIGYLLGLQSAIPNCSNIFFA